ncbi:glycosyltransferase family 4 protein [bacterium]|nr:glycosyltransferase family 4 protein [bacterium]
MDIPNERSSHLVPTPRGGGLSIVFNVMLGTTLLAVFMPTDIPWLWILLTSGALVVTVGLLDDLFSLSAIARLIIHFLAAYLIIFWIGTKLEIVFPRLIELRGPFAQVLVVFFTVWNINAYNFMDGMDGQAASQGVIVSLTAGTIAWINGNIQLAVVYYIIGASCAGFLKLNWHPAKIFMGDLCSGFLGISFAVLALWGKLSKSVPLPAFFILMGVFYVDATYTVLRRLLNGDNITKTHHDFAFQHALEKGYSHARVTGIIIVINLFWLTPLAWWSIQVANRWSFAITVLAYIPLVIIALLLKAGVPQKKPIMENSE